MAQQVDPNLWRGTVRGRLLVVALLFAAWIGVIQARLVQVQVYQHDRYVTRAKDQQTEELDLPAARGEIVDRHGKMLAYSVDADTLAAVPAHAGPPEEAVRHLCGALGDCSPQNVRELVDRFGKGGPYARVRRTVSGVLTHRITREQARRVRDLQLPWVIFGKTPRRWYPNKELAANVLGYVGAEEKGLAGLEGRYDSTLRGRPGKQLVLADDKGRPFLTSIGDPAVPGVTLELTIDRSLQFVAERELHAAVAEHDAAGGCVVMLDPFSGEILALANAPSFNPNVYIEASEESRRNRATQDAYEPGSTFKLVTAVAALEQKVVSPNEIIDTGNGTLRIGNYTVHDTHPHWSIPFTEVITKSSNIGAIKVGLRLGKERLGKYVQALGFGTRLSRDFHGENAGTVWDPAGWSDVTLSSVSYGYSVSATPLQLAAAVSAIANGGELVEPRLLRAVIRGSKREVVPRRVLRRALLPETAAQVTEIMEGVTEQGGTATVVQLEGYTVAGKTGTAQKIVNRRYSSLYNGSFVGFLPSRNPVVTIFVMLDTPRKGGYYGGVVAAPAFRRIAEATLRHLAVPPSINAVPPVLVERRDPRQPIPVVGPAHPLTIVPAGPLGEGQLRLPELRGLSGRAALKALSRLGLGARLTGEGMVIEQDPLPGTPVEPGASCRLSLARMIPQPPPGSRP